MTGGEVPSPRARRVRRPSWRDPRVGVGVLLVAGSVALGVWVVGSAGRGETYYAADRTLTPGDPLDADSLAVVEARLGGADARYVRVDGGLPAGSVATRVVAEGEMLPASAVGTGADVDVRPVGVPVDGPVPSAVVAGATVDLWLTRPPSDGIGVESAPARPELVAEALAVADVVEDGEIFAAGTATMVEVLVPEGELPVVLAALASEGSVTLVPAPGGS